MTSYKLKLVAALTMLIDHTAAVLGAIPHLNERYGVVFFTMRAIGRISFPIFAFLVAEGCVHTRDINKYLTRILTFAVIAELPFDIFKNFIYRDGWLARQNVLFTWALGITAVIILKKIGASKNFFVNILLIAAVFSAVVLAELGNTDYGAFGVLLIIMLYVYSPKKQTCGRGGRELCAYRVGQLLVITAFCCISYMPSPLFLAGALYSGVFIMLYNGAEGKERKLFFYAFYPAHLLVLGVLGAVIGSAIGR